MKKMNVLRVVMFTTLTALMAWGCAKKPTQTESPVSIEQPAEDVNAAPEPKMVETPKEEAAPQAETGPGLQSIQFDFDRYTLTSQARDILAGNAAYLKSHPGATVVIEGYCDERGSDEYNLALGERRAIAARDFLVTLGVAPNSLSTLTYGEERPLALGHDEEAWARNRRAEFNVISGRRVVQNRSMD